MKKRPDRKSAHGPRPAIRGLDPDDALLWHRVTQTLRPIDKKAKNRTGFDRHETGDEAGGAAARPAGEQKKKLVKSGRKQVFPKTAIPPVGQPVPPSAPPAINPIEKRLGRRIAKGTPGFDARIDLHGMTQIEAHDALLRFLRHAQARGSRIVLVITGKGRTDDDRDHFSMSEPPGVLRRNIRHWLEQAEFRTLVAAYAQAHRRHGGDGAIYVQLRRNRP